jgi:hypothetical protein
MYRNITLAAAPMALKSYIRKTLNLLRLDLTPNLKYDKCLSPKPYFIL